VHVKATGTTDASGAFTATRLVPNRPRLAGRELYFQAVVDLGNGARSRSNLLRVQLTP
jgi:hypothetical protein